MIPKFSPSKKFEYKMEFDTLNNDNFGSYIVNKIHENYKGRLDIFRDQGKGKPYAGSSTLGISAVDELAKECEANVMLPEESEFLFFWDKMPEKTTSYKDLGVVLDFRGNNHELALHLYERLLKEHQDFDLFPAIFTGLVTRLNDDIGTYGLVLETSDIYPYGLTTAKILAKPQGKFSKDDPNLIIEGVPSKLEGGERMLYTASQKKPSIDNLGLSGFGLDWGSALYSCIVGLAGSGSGGRVVLMRDKNEMHKIFGKIAKEREKYIKTLESAKNEIESKIDSLGK